MIRVEVYESGTKRKSWKWRFVSSNGRNMGSGRGFNTKEAAEKSINTFITAFKEDDYEIQDI